MHYLPFSLSSFIPLSPFSSHEPPLSSSFLQISLLFKFCLYNHNLQSLEAKFIPTYYIKVKLTLYRIVHIINGWRHTFSSYYLSPALSNFRLLWMGQEIDLGLYRRNIPWIYSFFPIFLDKILINLKHSQCKI